MKTALFLTNWNFRSHFWFYTFTEIDYLTIVQLYILFLFLGKKLEVDTVDHLEKDTVLVAFNSIFLTLLLYRVYVKLI